MIYKNELINNINEKRNENKGKNNNEENFENNGNIKK